MAKMNEDKAAMYLVAIVGVVAAVGILVLLMGAGIGSSSYSGQAIRTMSTSKTSGSIPSGVAGVSCPEGTRKDCCNPDCHTMCCF
ncbi:hypothetical protein HZA99_04180 [Candidatus Woesearchaeota archaeon]|nr:hypothetical protein [Candidatus Woesearchaeota archaeon]